MALLSAYFFGQLCSEIERNVHKKSPDKDLQKSKHVGCLVEMIYYIKGFLIFLLRCDVLYIFGVPGLPVFTFFPHFPRAPDTLF